MSISDRRSAPRVAFTTRVDLAVGCNDGECGLSCTDLSTGGMALESRWPLRPGSEVRFGTRLGDRREPYRGHGEVVWVRAVRGPVSTRFSLAIRFTELDDDCRAAVHAAVDRKLAETTAQLFPRPRTGAQLAH